MINDILFGLVLGMLSICALIEIIFWLKSKLEIRRLRKRLKLEKLKIRREICRLRSELSAKSIDEDEEDAEGTEGLL